MLVAHPSPPPALLSRPPSLFIYPGLIQSSGRSVCRKGSLPRQPSVTEQCIRTLRHPLLRKKNQSTTPGCIRGREGHLSHLSECHAGWLCDSVPITPPCTPGWACLPRCFSIHACHPGAASWLSNKSLGFSMRCEGKHHTAECSLTKKKKKRKKPSPFFPEFHQINGWHIIVHSLSCVSLSLFHLLFSSSL